MIDKIIRQNKSFFAIVVIFIVFFSAILYIGVGRIYDRESRWRHGLSIFQLNASKSVIKSFLSEFEHHSYFLKNLSALKGFVNSNFSSIQHRNELEDIFFNLAKSSTEFYQIKIIDNSGKERLRINSTDDDQTFTVKEKELSVEDGQPYFDDMLKSGRPADFSNTEIYIEYDRSGTHLAPVVIAATPLMNTEKEFKGILVFNILLSKMFNLLSDDIFIQTGSDFYFMKPKDGSIVQEKSDYHFSGIEGKIEISGTETIHYSQLLLSKDRKLVVAIRHRHMGLKNALDQLIIISGLLLSIFLGIIWFISFLNIRNYKEKNRSQLAIISSLVELTDWRDPDTGAHLKRTQHYSKLLAIQLRKNRKYRRVITDGFIENIFDTAPLHDIGKVGIRDYILKKPGKLSSEEIEKMKRHVEIGKHVLEDIMDRFKINQSFILVARNIAAYHHEKFDGSGYIKGLSGKEIPLEARIFSLADVYDALRSKRAYKDEIEHTEAVEMIKTESGKHFDPDIVMAFLDIEDRLSSISLSYTQSYKVP